MSEALSHPELALALARRLREVVLPELGSHAGRVELGRGAVDAGIERLRAPAR